jgi:hypothetical protein
MALIHNNDKGQTTEQSKQSSSNGCRDRHKCPGLFPVENGIHALSLCTGLIRFILLQQVEHTCLIRFIITLSTIQDDLFCVSSRKHILPVGQVRAKWRISPRPLQALFL